MVIPSEYSFDRYLAAKKSVDDRALNGRVWQALARALPPQSEDEPLRVLEAGAGIGTMIERMISGGLLNNALYTAVDSQEQNKACARRRLLEWSKDQGLSFTEESTDRWRIFGKGKRIEIDFVSKDILDFTSARRGKWDLLVANAFLDLLDVPATLPLLFKRLSRGGIFYFTINFDGLTILEPAIDPEFDEMVLELYHRSMDERNGESRTGRRIFAHLRNAGAHILDSGASDWVVFAGPGGYPEDEAYFLHYIVNDMRRAVMKYPEIGQRRLDDWIAARHGQIERGELTYVAHQLDFLGRLPE